MIVAVLVQIDTPSREHRLSPLSGAALVLVPILDASDGAKAGAVAEVVRRGGLLDPYGDCVLARRRGRDLCPVSDGTLVKA